MNEGLDEIVNLVQDEIVNEGLDVIVSECCDCE